MEHNKSSPNVSSSDDKCSPKSVCYVEFQSVIEFHNYASNTSSDKDDPVFPGFKSNADTLVKLRFLLAIIDSLKSKVLNFEFDIIDGIEFRSFACEVDLMEFSKHQKNQEDQVLTCQSDDGLEIEDDGSFSDMSSNHAIVPTKTKDITRIKGWRNKNFVRIQDSCSSFKIDDGYDEELQFKPLHDGSSEEGDSEGSPTPRKSRERHTEAIEPSNEAMSSELFSEFRRSVFGSSSPVVVEDRSYNESEAFTLKNEENIKREQSSVTNSTQYVDQFVTNSKQYVDQFSHKTKVENTTSSSSQGTDLQNKPTEDNFSFRNSLNGICKSLNLIYPQKREIYKPRVETSLIETIVKKINADSIHGLLPNTTSPLKPKICGEPQLRWSVPQDKILCGNIYDLEFSHPAISKCGSSTENVCTTKSIQGDNLTTVQSHFGESSSQCLKEENQFTKCYPENSAFLSNTLDEYTTHLDKLHIDFNIPRLDAANADGIDGDIVSLCVENDGFPLKTDKKPATSVKAKTVAERRRIIQEMNNETKREKKLSFKIRANVEQTKLNKKQGRDLKKKHAQIEAEQNKKKSKLQESTQKKKNTTTNNLFDNYGCITYGKEKPLISRLTDNLKLPHSELCPKWDNNSRSNSELAMIINVGLNRHLFKEAADNLKSIFGCENRISLQAATFAVAALQRKLKPSTVTRFLVPVLNQDMFEIRHQNKQNAHKSVKTNRRKINLEDIQYFSSDYDDQLLSAVTMEFAKVNEIDPVICKTVSDVVNFVERKTYFDNIEYICDPDVPANSEKDMITNTYNCPRLLEKTKKTRLERQIEHLGGTFITVQSDKGKKDNEECFNDHCKLGCVCLKNVASSIHCRKESCMFVCHCANTFQIKSCDIKSKIWLNPEVLKQKHTLQKNLAPLEREYHQTVVMSEDQSTITIESQNTKRKRKIPIKYKDDILFDDYSKEVNSDNEFLNIIKICKQSQHQLGNNNQKIHHSKIHSLGLFLKLQAHNIQELKKRNLVLCYVKIKNFKNKLMPRNVADKKSGGITHKLMIKNDCSRSFGVSDYFTLRNTIVVVKTNSMTLYPDVGSYPSASNSFFNLKENESLICKEDLELENEINAPCENELMCLDIVEDEGAGLAINYICSLHPDEFENQESIEFEENYKLELAANTLVLPLQMHKSDFSNDLVTNDSNKGKRAQMIYATLPIFDTECKWWVVELDENKFSYLCYRTRDRKENSVNIEYLLKATFRAAFTNGIVKIPIRKDSGNHRDKFGAYAVPGHYHLIFYGPYDLNECHGLVAIKNDGNRALFNSTFSESEVFKSLGIIMSKNKNTDEESENYVKATWWFSTSKKENYDEQKAEEILSNKNIASSLINSSSNNSSADSKIMFQQKSALLNAKLTSVNDDCVNQTHKTATYDQNLARKNLESSDLIGNTEELQPSESSSVIKRKKKRRRRLTISRTKKHKLSGTNQIEEANERGIVSNEMSNILKETETPKEDNILVDECPINIENIPSDTSDIEFFDDSSLSKPIEPFSMNLQTNSFNQAISVVVDKAGIRTYIHKPPTTFESRQDREPGKITAALVKNKPFPGYCPEFGLLCLKPGVGYIPVWDHKPNKLIMKDPVFIDISHQFVDQWHASDWLNMYFEKFSNLNTLNMEWVMVKGAFIKHLEVFNIHLLKEIPKKEYYEAELLEHTEESCFGNSDMKNQAERSRRATLKKLKDHLSSLIFADGYKIRQSFFHILTTADVIIKAQKLINVWFEKEEKKLRERNLFLEAKLKCSIASLHPREKKRAQKICHTLQRNSVPHRSMLLDELLNSMKTLEIKVASELRGKEHVKSRIRTLLQNLTHEDVKDSPNRQAPERRLSESISVTDRPKVGSIDGKVTEIISLDSDCEDTKEQVIEIESDGENVVCVSNTSSDNDVKIISTSMPRIGRFKNFPKPKRRMPNYSQRSFGEITRSSKSVPSSSMRSGVDVQPEYVDVPIAYEDILCSSGDSDSNSSYSRKNPAQYMNETGKFLPISQSGRVNIFSNTPIETVLAKNQLKQPEQESLLKPSSVLFCSSKRLNRESHEQGHLLDPLPRSFKVPGSPTEPALSADGQRTITKRSYQEEAHEFVTEEVIDLPPGPTTNKVMKVALQLPQGVFSSAPIITKPSPNDSRVLRPKLTPTIAVSHLPGSSTSNIFITTPQLTPSIPIRKPPPLMKMDTILNARTNQHVSCPPANVNLQCLKPQHVVAPLVSSTSSVQVPALPGSTTSTITITTDTASQARDGMSGSVRPTANPKIIKCKNMSNLGKWKGTTPIQGKKVLVTLPGWRTSKGPGMSLLKRPSLNDSTVTLHSPSGDASETRTVQFAPLNCVSVKRPDGPDIKVLIPKRAG